MVWVKADFYDKKEDEDRPRKMTEDEINYILDQFPYPKCADRYTSMKKREGIVAELRQQMKYIEICPSAIKTLGNSIIQQHSKSLVEPGTSTGTVAGEAVGSATTQMTLNTFHQSGSAKSASSGIESMKNIIFAKKEPNDESTTIYFKNKLITFEEALNTRRQIVGSVVMDFVMDYKILINDKIEKEWWHKNANILMGKKIPNAYWVMKLILNPIEMYKHHVSIKDIAGRLSDDAPKSSTALVAVYGPMSDAVLYLYPDKSQLTGLTLGCVESNKESNRSKIIPSEDTIAEMGKDMDLSGEENIKYINELAYLETCVYPELSKIRVKGVSGIKNLIPISYPVWSAVLSEQVLKKGEMPEYDKFVGKAWVLHLNNAVVRSTGISIENLSALCKDAGVKVLGKYELNQSILIVLPLEEYQTLDETPVVKKNKQYYRIFSKNDLIYSKNDKSVKKGEYFVKISKSKYKKAGDQYVEVFEAGKQKHFGQYQPASEFKEFIIEKTGKIAKQKLYRKLMGKLLFEEINSTETKVYEKIDSDLVRLIKPSKFISDKVTEAKREYKIKQDQIEVEKIKKARNLDKDDPERRRLLISTSYEIPTPSIINSSSFIIAETDGSNLKKLLSLPFIDSKRTTCNNVHTIADSLGIENVMTYLVRALSNTIANTASYIHPTNITFIAEFITNRGEPIGATYSGISRQPTGHLSLATVERAAKVFTKHALHGRKEDIRNVSASVGLGSKMAMGTGMSDVAQDVEIDGVVKRLINEDLYHLPDQEEGLVESLHEKDYSNLIDQMNMAVADNLGIGVDEKSDLAGAFEDFSKKSSDIPSQLIDALSQIKSNIPLDDNEYTEIVDPLDGKIITTKQSTGLVSDLALDDEYITPESEYVDPSDAPDFLLKIFKETPKHLLETKDLPKEFSPSLEELGNIPPIEDELELPDFDLSESEESESEETTGPQMVDIEKMVQGMRK